jgi:hypothetical protein
LYALAADAVKLDGMAPDVMTGLPTRFLREFAMQGHIEVTDRATAFANKVAVITDDRVVAHHTVANIPAGDPALFEQDANVPVKVSQAY